MKPGDIYVCTSCKICYCIVKIATNANEFPDMIVLWKLRILKRILHRASLEDELLWEFGKRENCIVPTRDLRTAFAEELLEI